MQRSRLLMPPTRLAAIWTFLGIPIPLSIPFQFGPQESPLKRLSKLHTRVFHLREIFTVSPPRGRRGVDFWKFRLPSSLLTPLLAQLHDRRKILFRNAFNHVRSSLKDNFP